MRRVSCPLKWRVRAICQRAALSHHRRHTLLFVGQVVDLHCVLRFPQMPSILSCLVATSVFVLPAVAQTHLRAVAPATCNIRDVTIEVAKAATSNTPLPATADAVKRKVMRASFADPRSTTVSCIDARDSAHVFGTPGGEASEFVTAVAVFKEFGGAVSTEADVKNLFNGWMATADPSRPFYLHTDQAKMNAVYAAVGLTASQFANIRPLEQNQPNLRQNIFTQMLTPNNMGCGHVRLMFNSPNDYQVPQFISSGFIKAFLEYMWDADRGAPVEMRHTTLPELPGSLDGRAIVVVSTDASALALNDPCRNMQPQVSPSDTIGSTFIVTPAAVAVLRRRLVNHFARISPFPNADDMLRRFNELGDIHTGNSVGVLAPTLPIYTAKVHLAPSSGSDVAEKESQSTTIALAIVILVLVAAAIAMVSFSISRARDAAAASAEASRRIDGVNKRIDTMNQSIDRKLDEVQAVLVQTAQGSGRDVGTLEIGLK